MTTLNQFKNIETEIANLYGKAILHFNDWEANYDTIKEFNQKIITNNNKELYLTIYENVRDSVLHRKPKTEKQEERVKMKE